MPTTQDVFAGLYTCYTDLALVTTVQGVLGGCNYLFLHNVMWVGTLNNSLVQQQVGTVHS